jgi:RNA recognition motif-containing protein
MTNRASPVSFNHAVNFFLVIFQDTGFLVSSPLGAFQLGKRLYVGNLGYGVSSNDLEQMFAEHGAVLSAQVITDRETGRSKGFGFVEMGTDQEAQDAITALNGKSVEGRNLTVNEARPQEGGGGRRGGGGGGGGFGGGGGGRGGYGGGGGGGGRGGYGGGRGGGGGGRY